MTAVRLTPLQAQTLALLAQPGAYLVGRWGGAGFYLIGADRRLVVRWSTYIKLSRADYITDTPHTYPREHRITAAGRAAYAADQQRRADGLPGAEH